MTRNSLLANTCGVALIIAASLASPMAAQAADAGSTNAANPVPTVSAVVVEGETVTTAPRTVPLTTAYSESTITSSDINNLSPQQSLQTLLSNQPSVFTFQNGPNGVGATILFRAFNSGQFAETFDGVAINDIFNGGVTGQASTVNSVLFIPANVDSVVLSRGINNPAVNSYNSLGGTINFLPKRPSADFGGSLGGSYGSFNSFTAQGSINTGDFHGLKQLLQFDHRESDSWLPNNKDRNTNVYYSALYDVPNGNQVSLVGVYDRNDGHNPLDVPVPLLQQSGGFFQYPLSVSNEAAKDTEYMVILGYVAKLTPNITFENKVFGGGQNYLRTSYANPADSNSPYKLPNQAENYDFWLFYPNGPTYNPKTAFGSKAAGNAYHFYGYTNWAIGYTPKVTVDLPHNTVIIGGNITYGELHSREYWYGSAPVPQTLGFNDAWDEHDRRLFVSAYGQDEIKLLNDTVTLTPGVKYQFANTIDTDSIGFFYPYGGTDRDKEDFISPTVGLNYKPISHLSFNFAFGQNIKFPDISAYYNNVPGSTALGFITPPPVKIKPEHVNDYELGARYQAGGFSASVDVYREDLTDAFIDTFDSVTLENHVSNGGSARYEGVEVQLQENLKLGEWGDLQGYFNYAYNNAVYTSAFVADSVGTGLSNSQTQVFPGEPLPDVPEVLISAGLTWTYDNFQFSPDLRYIGNQYITNDDNGLADSRIIPGHIVVDLSLSKTIPLNHAGLWGKALKLSINVDNLFDRYYFNDAYSQSNTPYVGNTEFATPAAPRSVIGRVEVRF